MELDGADYAIFTDGNFYYIPYFDPTEGFASLNNTAITQPITQSGENAVVVNLCFGAGTLIATPTGERVVESLRIGDLITTADGRHVPVKWLGQQTHQTPAVNMRLPDRAQPVRIRAGALGGGLPHTDLLVTGDHAMLLDGMLINAAALVNGASIDWVPMAELGNSFTVYHVEVEAHEVILANGAQTESFVDVAGRKTFDNYNAYMARYGSERIIPEMRVPRITAQRMVPAYIGDRHAS
ncbi:Hint domain-containing protein [uncultured Tateyamaria sp.]|uniref:Hint domain-containing protein n=1 Tax=uncultured Tateyamaria sp. TaxID=455651 RepID=UPI002622B708|nr:Hint domain-containing protein [uncultured Tateyamaria sp.]